MLKREGKGGRSTYMIPLPRAGNAGYAGQPFSDKKRSGATIYLYLSGRLPFWCKVTSTPCKLVLVKLVR